MNSLALKIGTKIYELEIAETADDLYEGLSGDDQIDPNEGMFFIFDEDGTHGMVMRGMDFPIDIIHLSQEGIVNTIASAEIDDPISYEGDVTTRFVIELMKGQATEAGLSVGDTIKLPVELHEYLAKTRGVGIARNGGTPTANASTRVKEYNIKVTDIPEQSDHLQVLGHDGEVLSNIKMGARIFSRPHTKILVEAAKIGDSPENLKALGQLMVQMIYKQDTQEPEYST